MSGSYYDFGTLSPWMSTKRQVKNAIVYFARFTWGGPWREKLLLVKFFNIEGDINASYDELQSVVV